MTYEARVQGEFLIVGGYAHDHGSAPFEVFEFPLSELSELIDSATQITRSGNNPALKHNDNLPLDNTRSSLKLADGRELNNIIHLDIASVFNEATGFSPSEFSRETKLTRFAASVVDTLHITKKPSL